MLRPLIDRHYPCSSVAELSPRGLFTICHLRFTMLLMSVPFIEENDQTRARQEHLEALRQLVGNAYPNKFERSHTIDPRREDTITALVEKFRAFEPQTDEGERPAS